MTQLEHTEFARRAYADEIIIGVEPALARRFFMDHTGDALERDIGERALVERAIVGAAFWLNGLAILASVPAAVFAFSWWSIAAVPVTVIALWGYHGSASVGRQKLCRVTLALIGAVGMCLMYPTYLRQCVFLVSLTAAFFFARLTFASASLFVRALVVRNERAFNLLNETVVFVRSGTDI
jgi:hypothetical protein